MSAIPKRATDGTSWDALLDWETPLRDLRS
jgi:hypothetical protein